MGWHKKERVKVAELQKHHQEEDLWQLYEEGCDPSNANEKGKLKELEKEVGVELT